MYALICIIFSCTVSLNSGDSQAVLAATIWVALYGMFKQVKHVWQYFKLSFSDFVRNMTLSYSVCGYLLKASSLPLSLSPSSLSLSPLPLFSFSLPRLFPSLSLQLIWVVVFLATVFLGVDLGLGVGVAFSLFVIIYRTIL